MLSALLFLYLALWAAVADRPPWGDEEHYLQTVRVFGAGLTVELLRTYEELSTPLAFIVYSYWGRVIGFETWQLRLLSPFLAVATCGLLWLVLADISRNRREALIGLAMIAFNPYFVGLAVFIFTDMLALAMLGLTVFGFHKRMWAIVCLGIAGSILTRQYLAFMVPAVVVASIVDPRLSGRRQFEIALAAMCGLFALFPLFDLWDRHLSPSNSLRAVYTAEGMRYDPHALSLYLAAPGAYLAPLLLRRLFGKPPRKFDVAVGLLGACVVLAYPIQPSVIQLEEGTATVGFLHRGITALLPPFLVAFAFAVLAFGGITATTRHAVLRQTMPQDRRWSGAPLLAWTGMISFFAVMPFSFQPWEKYALPQLLLLAIVLSAQPRHGTI